MLEIKQPSAVQEVMIKPEVSLENATAVRGVVAVPHEKREIWARGPNGAVLQSTARGCPSCSALPNELFYKQRLGIIITSCLPAGLEPAT